jgi:phosphoribosylformylglycinamidine synthase I
MLLKSLRNFTKTKSQVMSKRVNVIVLRSAGTNCNEETAYAFKYFGANVVQVHIDALVRGDIKLNDSHILALPGGFSYGDDIASGRILANELRLKLGDQIRFFIEQGKLIIGICNGFQILVKAGILPGIQMMQGQEATLYHNDSAHFEARWTPLAVNESKCVWTKGIPSQVYLPVAHGEGKFMIDDEGVLEQLKANGQIVLRYCDSDGNKPQYPDNPNGSVDDIAGICDPSGRVLGLMPHPERHLLFEQHPFWTRLARSGDLGDGAAIFLNGIEYIRKNF